MPILRIQHAVPNFEGWKRAFESDPMDRKGSGVRRYQIHRAVTDPNFVMIDLEFDTVAEAEGMLGRLRQLWAGPGGAVMRNPAAWIVETIGTTSERAVPILPADDLGAAKEFYVGALGFRVLFEATDDGKNGILGLERGTIRITLDAPMSGHGRDACVSLQVNSADDYYREWRERVEIRQPPKDKSWGARTFDVIDPSGNTIFVIGPSGE